jgi:uncharacterized membrane-anchored protein
MDINPVVFFTVAALLILVSRRVPVVYWVTLVLFGMLIAGTQAADLVARPLAELFAWINGQG